MERASWALREGEQTGQNEPGRPTWQVRADGPMDGNYRSTLRLAVAG